MKHTIDFRTPGGDTGEKDVSSIVPITNGEPADSVVFKRSPEHLRARTEQVRDLLREHALLKDYNEGGGATLYGGGTVTPVIGGGGQMTFTMTEGLYLLPLNTAGGGANSPYLVSTKASLTVGTPGGADELIFTSVKRQFEGSTFPASDPNRISVQILDNGGASSTVAVTVTGATGDENNIEIVLDSTVNTLTEVIAAVAALPAAAALVVASLGGSASGASLCPLWGPVQWAGDYTKRFLAGGLPGVAHQLLHTDFVTFFSTAANELQKGDTLAVGYDKVIDTTTPSTGGRVQSIPENINVHVGSSLFNTREHPERVPNSIVICKRIDTDNIVFANGAVIKIGSPATLWSDSYVNASSSSGTLSTPLGWTRMDTGTVHSPPVSIQDALDNADGHLDVIYDRYEGVVTTCSDNAVSFGGQFSGSWALTAAISHVLSDKGGTILLKKGTYQVTSSQVFTKNVTIIGVEDGVVITNDLSTGPMFKDLYNNGWVKLENVEIASGFAGNHHHFEVSVYGAKFSIKNCNFVDGYVDTASGVCADNFEIVGSTFSNSTSNATVSIVCINGGSIDSSTFSNTSGTALLVNGGFVSVSKSLIYNTGVGLPHAFILINPRVTIDSCQIAVNSPNTGILSAVQTLTNKHTLRINNCILSGVECTAAGSLIDFSVDAVSIENMNIQLSQDSPTTSMHASVMSVVGTSGTVGCQTFNMRDVDVDLGGVLWQYSAGYSPFKFTPYAHGHVDGLHIKNAGIIPDPATSGHTALPVTDPFIMAACVAGEFLLENSHVEGFIQDSTAGSASFELCVFGSLGDSHRVASPVNAGRQIFRGNEVVVDAFTTAISSSSYARVFGNLRQRSVVENNRVYVGGGYLGSVVDCIDVPQVQIVDNMLISGTCMQAIVFVANTYATTSMYDINISRNTIDANVNTFILLSGASGTIQLLRTIVANNKIACMAAAGGGGNGINVLNADVHDTLISGNAIFQNGMANAILNTGTNTKSAVTGSHDLNHIY